MLLVFVEGQFLLQYGKYYCIVSIKSNPVGVFRHILLGPACFAHSLPANLEHKPYRTLTWSPAGQSITEQLEGERTMDE